MTSTLNSHARAVAHYGALLVEEVIAEGLLPELCSNTELAGRLRAYSLRELDVEIAATLLTAADRLVDGALCLEV